MNKTVKQCIDIGNRRVGPGNPCLVIAEAGVNHNGNLDLARRLVHAAADAGADVVKFQTFRTDRLAAKNAPKARYQQETTAADESQADMLRRLELSGDDHRALKAECERRGIQFMSTPFDEESADFLRQLGVPAFKISSGDLTNLPLLSHVARLGRPMIISTGMATLGDVEAAVDAIAGSGMPPLAILQCVSNYPADAGDVNLRAMQTLAQAFGAPVGYSDHTLGIEVALAAVALGAAIIEKHFTLDCSLPGPDHRASLEPEALAAMIAGIRKIESCLGNGRKQPTPAELEVARVARKSLFWSRACGAGEVVAAPDLIALRPASGMPPGRRDALVGRRLARAVEAGDAVREGDFEEGAE